MSRRANLSLYLLFFIQPLAWGGWLVRISEIQQKLDLSPASLSTAIVAVPIGLMLSLAFASRLYARWGVKRSTASSLMFFLIIAPIPVFASSWIALFIALFFVGFGLAATELGLNVAADIVEKRGGRPIMGTAHGFWSLGLLTGSVVSTGLAWAGISAGAALIVLAIVSGMIAVWVFKNLPDLTSQVIENENNKTKNRSFYPGWGTASISLFAFGIALGEGAMADWAAVYMTDVHAAPFGTEGLGFVVFAVSIVLARFALDRVRGYMTPVRIGVIGCGVAMVGVTVLVFASAPLFSYCGFAMVGVGLAAGFPMAVTAVASQPGRSAEAHVAFLSQITLCGQLLGPLLIGFTAEVAGMQFSFMVLIPVLVMSLLLAKQLMPAK
ncbi:MFS transporter [Loktanella sp. D2R18]|uniref:MFS transporter n=1 Tax=Rhodobacterales TaxID=204455 RepID=UPI000DE88115|nr:MULTISPECIES: MFS transporter [Rhodobacterales]MDO6591892.1 MFS transporter [Yoonia sp. 1_MG-2023]RBW42677.1 MFS transporter [Loktanella sp. D2R18]